MVIIQVFLHCPKERVSKAEHLWFFCYKPYKYVQMKAPRLWFYIPFFSNGLQCYENFWDLNITSCCNFAIFNAQIPSLLACESSLWIQCTLLQKFAGYLCCPFCCLSISVCNTDTCYAFVSLINLWICRKSMSHWFLESVRISGRESHWPWH